MKPHLYFTCLLFATLYLLGIAAFAQSFLPAAANQATPAKSLLSHASVPTGAPALQHPMRSVNSTLGPITHPSTLARRLRQPTRLATVSRNHTQSAAARQDWVARYQAPNSTQNQARDLAVDANGDVVVVGTSYGRSGADRDYATVKYAPDGQKLWEQRYDGASATIHGFDEVTAVALDGAGNVVVTGTSYTTDDAKEDYFTIKYSASGQQLWAARFNGGNLPNVATGLALDAAGNVYVTGLVVSPSFRGINYCTVKYSPSGQQLWATPLDLTSSYEDRPTGIAVDAAGDVVVTGSRSSREYRTCKYAGANGALIWAAAYSESASTSAMASGLAVDAAGDVVVTGAATGGSGNNYDYVTLKYAGTNGQQLWKSRYNTSSDYVDIPTAVVVDAAGNAIVTGSSFDPNSNDRWSTALKYASSSGQQVWVAQNPKLGFVQYSGAAVDPAGNVYLVSTAYGSNHDYQTRKLSAEGDLLWEAYYNAPSNGDNAVVGIGLDAKGNVFVTGTSNDGKGASEFSTLKYKQSSNSLSWEARFTGAAAGADLATAGTTDKAGNVYVTGYTYNGSSYDYATIKYAANGQQLWEEHYNGGNNGDDVPVAIAVDAAGDVYVCGTSWGGITGYDFATVKYSGTSGSSVWTKRFDLSRFDEAAAAMTLDAAGNVLVTGAAQGTGRTGGPGSYEYRTIKYSASGEELWSQRFVGYPFSEHVATDLGVDATGNVFVTGLSFFPNTLGYATIKYSASGQQLWIARYAGTGVSVPTALAVDAAGNVVVTGNSPHERDVNNYDYATVKYDGASGQQVWEARYNGPANRHDLAADVAVDATGGVVVTGNSDVGGNWDYVTLKYSTTGQQVWASNYNGPAESYDEATALALDAAGNAYVTGFSYNQDGTDDYATLKYATNSGQQLWEARYNGPGNSYDEPAALFLDGGNVHVTGFSFGRGSGYDYATLQYRQPDGAGPTTLVGTPLSKIKRASLEKGVSSGGRQELAVYPNPATGPTTVRFRPVLDGPAQVLVFNQLGQQVATLYEGKVRQGQFYELSFQGQQLPAGLYTCSLTASGQRETVRVVVAR